MLHVSTECVTSRKTRKASKSSSFGHAFKKSSAVERPYASSFSAAAASKPASTKLSFHDTAAQPKTKEERRTKQNPSMVVGLWPLGIPRASIGNHRGPKDCQISRKGIIGALAIIPVDIPIRD